MRLTPRPGQQLAAHLLADAPFIVAIIDLKIAPEQIDCWAVGAGLAVETAALSSTAAARAVRG
jgi:hypothetical protein